MDEIKRGNVEFIHNERVVFNGSSSSQDRFRRQLENYNGDYSPYSPSVHNRYPHTNHDLNVNRPEYSNLHFEGTSNNIRTLNESLRSRPVTSSRPPRSASTHERFKYPLYHDEGPSSYAMNNYYSEPGERTRYRDRNFYDVEKLENGGRVELMKKIDELKDRLSPYTYRYGSSLKESYPQRDIYQQEVIWAPPLRPQPEYTRGPYREHFYGYDRDFNHDAYMLHQNERVPHERRDRNRHLPPHVDPSSFSYPNYDHNMNPIVRRGSHGYSFEGPNLSASHSRQSTGMKLSTDWDNSEKDGLNRHRPRKVEVDRRRGRVWRPVAGGAPLVACGKCFELLKLPRKYVSKNHKKMKCGACSSIILFEFRNKDSNVIDNNPNVTVSVISENVIDNDPNVTVNIISENVIDNSPNVTVDENVECCLGDGSNSADTNVCSNNYDDALPEFCPDDKKSNCSESEKQLNSLSSNLNISEEEQIPENLISGRQSTSSEEYCDDFSDNIVAGQFDEGDQIKISEFDDNSLKNVAEMDMSVNEFSDSSMCHNSMEKNKEDPIMVNEGADSVIAGHIKTVEMDVSVNEFSDSSVCHDSKEKSKQDPIMVHEGAESVIEGHIKTAEMDVSVNEFSDSSVCHNSMEKSKQDPIMVNEGAESVVAGHIKTSFGDLTNSNQNVEFDGSQVFVNGKLIPDSAVKNAEKLAGPIQPGSYWYDVQAGFWGVMGHPCLGLIMPNIKEFSYPMPKNCSAGNTGVLVNGRELHKKDLNLLASRGLPNTMNKCYRVEISGKVIDQETGEELNGLGQLAPTVAKAKRGFGMKVPRFIAGFQR